MAVISPDKMIPVAVLAQLGMSNIDLRGVDFSPAVQNRGIQADTKILSWKCTITSKSASRPMVMAIRDNPTEAEFDARQRFYDIFSGKGKPGLSPIIGGPEEAPKPKQKPPAKPAAAPPDDDMDDLV